MSPEAAAREMIDELLIAAGWTIQNSKAFAGAARGIALREVPLDSERCDYLLLVGRISLGVIEATKDAPRSPPYPISPHTKVPPPDFLSALFPGMKKIPFASESTGVEALTRCARQQLSSVVDLACSREHA